MAHYRQEFTLRAVRRLCGCRARRERLAHAERVLRVAASVDVIGNVGAVPQDARARAVRVDERQVYKIDQALLRGRIWRPGERYRQLTPVERLARRHHATNALLVAACRRLRQRLE